MNEETRLSKEGMLMGITVREVWELKEFQQFQLVAGESGLNRKIEAVGILDYEFALQNSDEPKKWTFRKNDFVISSLLFAKDHEELLMKAVISLCEDQVSALAVKDVCYPQLPKDVLDYADQNGLPVFMFGRDDAYFEDIVVSLKSKIAERSNMEFQEHRISMFLKGELDIKGQREINREILPNRVQPYRMIYCFVKEDEKTIRDYRKFYQLNVYGGNKGGTFYYKGGCFIVQYVNGDREDKKDRTDVQVRERLLDSIRKPPEHYWIGIGNIHEDPDELLTAMIESRCAQQYAQLFELHSINFNEMGGYQILLPCFQDKWFQGYSSKIIDVILAFDRQYDGDLYKTLEQYAKSYGNILEVAKQMHLHKNTVRYRLNKVRELLNMEDDPSFDMQIFMAMMIDELNKWFYE